MGNLPAVLLDLKLLDFTIFSEVGEQLFLLYLHSIRTFLCMFSDVYVRARVCVCVYVYVWTIVESLV